MNVVWIWSVVSTVSIIVESIVGRVARHIEVEGRSVEKLAFSVPALPQVVSEAMLVLFLAPVLTSSVLRTVRKAM